MNSKCRIIGIDPGLQCTGWAIIDSDANRITFVDAGTIITKVEFSLPDRLLEIHNRLQAILQQYQPQEAALEETYVNKNFASSLKLSHARAASMLTLSINGLSPKEYPAKIVKKAIVGNGNADKRQVAYMLKYLAFPNKELTKDSADALAVSICHNSYRK